MSAETMTKSQLHTTIDDRVNEHPAFKEMREKVNSLVEENGGWKEDTQEKMSKAFEDFRDDIMKSLGVEIDKRVAISNGRVKAGVGVGTGDPNLIYDMKAGYRNFGEFAIDVMKAYKSSGRVVSDRLSAWKTIACDYEWVKSGDMYIVNKAADSTSLREDEDEFGGFLIPPEFRNELWLAVEQENNILPRCTPYPMTVPMMKVNAVDGFDESGALVYGGIKWYWGDELSTGTATRPKFQKITLELKKITGLAYASEEMISDSPISVQTTLQNGFRGGLSFTISNVLVRGNGAGQPLGAINAPCKVRVSKETGQASSTLVIENIIKMFSRLFNKQKGIWLINDECIPQLFTMTLDVGTGGAPVFLGPNALAGVPYATLLGLPIMYEKHCSALGSEGDVILADWSQYLFGTKAGQGATGQFNSSIHFKFDSGQEAFRFMFRCDGEPWWSTYYTPPQATSHTMSPFVTLQAR